LADAKHRVDDVLSGRAVTLSFKDAETAEAFKIAAEALGAKCESEPLDDKDLPVVLNCSGRDRNGIVKSAQPLASRSISARTTETA
jgi:hypothetical protein